MSKGSTQRPHDHEKWSREFDRIFGKPEKAEKPKDNVDEKPKDAPPKGV